MSGQGIHARLDLTDFLLLAGNLFGILLYLLVTFCNKILSVGDLLLDKRKIRKHIRTLGGVLRELLVNDRYLALQPGLLFFLSLDILSLCHTGQRHT